MNLNEKIWINGTILQAKDAHIPVLTHGLHYGTSVFEGIRVYDKVPFRLHEHIARLFLSAKAVSIEIPYSEKQIADICTLLIKLNNKRYGYIRPFAWLGSEDLRVGGKNISNIAVAIWETSLDHLPDIANRKQVSLCISDWRKPDNNVFPAQCKGAGAYAMNVVAKYKAQELGYDDAIILDVNNMVGEVTTSNIFFVKEGHLYTPPAKYVLNGITRQEIIKIVVKEKIMGFTEKFFTVDELLNADEIFITGTTIEIASVGRVLERKFNIGNYTKIISDAFIKATKNYSLDE